MMSLIKNTIERKRGLKIERKRGKQGLLLCPFILSSFRPFVLSSFPPESPLYDIIIIGAGPAGLSAAYAARNAGLNYLVIERGCIVHTIYQFPTGLTDAVGRFQKPASW